MKPLILIPFILMGCNQMTKENMCKVNDCDAGVFNHCLNSPEYSVLKDTITMFSSAKTDFFNAPDGSACTSNAPLLLKKLDNTHPFTFSARVKPAFQNTYDAGAVYVFCNEKLWQKFAFEMDERKRTRLVTVRTIGTSDDNNHDSITQEEVYMKISSDTKSIGFYYSVDGNTWQLVRLYRNEYPDDIYIAISSQSPIGNGTVTHFTDIKFSENSIENFRMGL